MDDEVERPRVALVTSVEVDGVIDDLDRPFIDAAFARADIEVVHSAWEDERVDWDAFDLVVVRTTWNYVERESEFRVFLDRFHSSMVLHNPAALIEWNIDKHYLRDLEAAGVPVVATAFVASVDEIDGAIASVDAPEIVVKPTISAGSRLTGRFVAGDRRAAELAHTILRDGRCVMVQPYLPAVDDEGEYAVVMIDGAIAHRARKAQILDTGGTFVGGEYREVITPADADEELDTVALRAAGACRDRARELGVLAADEELLYARCDITRMPSGDAVLLEAELFEPALFLPVAPATADLLAAASRRRVDVLR